MYNNFMKFARKFIQMVSILILLIFHMMFDVYDDRTNMKSVLRVITWDEHIENWN